MRSRTGIIAAAVMLLGSAGCGTQPAAEALKNARTESAALKALNRLIDEKGGDALANAFCTGATSYIDSGGPPSGEDWVNYLLAEGGSPLHQIQEDVDRVGAALELAQQNTGAAHAYIRACARFP